VLPDVVKATTIAFVNANSLKRAQSRKQPSNTPGAASWALIPTQCVSTRESLAACKSRARV
jgi:hypothetical protein